MKKFKSIIVDDEQHGRENLASILKNYCSEIEIVGEASSASEARQLILELEPEVIFLDILMPIQNGFDLLDQFIDRNFAVIFVSASVDFGIQAVKAGILDYVLKPININDLQLAVGKIKPYFDKLMTKNEIKKSEFYKIALSHSNGFAMEEISNIVRLHADDNYTRVFTASGKQYLISRPLMDFEKALPPGVFVRTHKSFMINIEYLKDYSNEDGGTVLLSDGFKIPVSKRKNALFIQRLKQFSLMLRS